VAARSWGNPSVAATPRLLTTLSGHSGPVRCLAAFGNGTRLLSGGNDGAARVRENCVFPSNDSFEEEICFVPPPNSFCRYFAPHFYFLFTHCLQVWALDSAQSLLSSSTSSAFLTVLRGHSGAVNCCAVYGHGAHWSPTAGKSSDPNKSSRNGNNTSSNSRRHFLAS